MFEEIKVERTRLAEESERHRWPMKTLASCPNQKHMQVEKTHKEPQSSGGSPSCPRGKAAAGGPSANQHAAAPVVRTDTFEGKPQRKSSSLLI